MRIAVCDDEKRFIADFTAIVNKLYRSLDLVTDVFSDGNQLLKNFMTRQYDIVFLDIEMPEIDGITLAKRIRAMNENVCIVFLTGHVEYAIKGYEVNALRYLTKPATEQSISEVINYVIERMNSRKYLWIKNPEGEYRVMLSDIIFIESQDQKIVVNTLSGSLEQRGKLNDYEERLRGEGFFRIHRSYLVALSKVVGISGRDVTMANGFVLPVGRTKENEFRNALIALVNKEAF